MDQIAGGFFIDEHGRTWKQPYKTSNGAPQVSYLGQVERDARGRLVPDSVRRLLAGACAPHSFVASSLMDPDELVALQEVIPARPLTITGALATDHAVLHMGRRQEGTILSVFTEKRGIEAAVFDWGDGVLETLATRFWKPSPIAKPEESMNAALKGAFRWAGDLTWFKSKQITVLVYDEDGSAVPLVRQTLSSMGFEHVAIVAKGMADVLSGAALRTARVYGERSDCLNLEAMWCPIDLAWEGHRYRFVEWNTTVPTAHEKHLDLQPGDTPYLELVSPTDASRVMRWPLPGALLPKDSGRSAVSLKVTIDVDAAFTTTVSVEDNKGFKRQMSLSEVKANGGKRQAQGDAMDEIMDMISIVDDVDFGLASLSQQDRQSGAGQGLAALQKRLLSTLAKRGVQYYPALGKLFDPQIHQAVATVSHPGVPNNCVVEEVRRGFVYDGRIIRYSHVKVANPL